MDLSAIHGFILLLLLPLPIFFLCRRTSSSKESYPAVRNLVNFLMNRHRLLEWVTDILAGSPTHTATFKLPGLPGGVITADPSNVEHILKHRFPNYPKGDRSISMLEDLLGRGILNSAGDNWKLQRRLAVSEIAKKSFRNFTVETVQREITGNLLPLLGKAGEIGQEIDLQRVLERFAFDVVCRVAFGEDPRRIPDAGRVAEAFGEASRIIIGRFTELFPLVWQIKKKLDIGSERKLRESLSVVHDFAATIVRCRKKTSVTSQESGDDDLLSRFAANEEATEELLRDLAINFVVAGRETTSSALAWFFWLLSSRPDVEEKILHEINSIRASSSGDDSDDLRRMHYLHAAITETLRLYPPVPIDSHSCREDDVMPDGTFVGKGWTVSYSAYTMGRSERIWGEDCGEFKPERWVREGTFRPENPFRFPVFHAGPRVCLGKELAYVQMKAVAAAVLQAFAVDVRLDKETPPEHLLSMTFKIKGRLPVLVRKRV